MSPFKEAKISLIIVIRNGIPRVSPQTPSGVVS